MFRHTPRDLASFTLALGGVRRVRLPVPLGGAGAAGAARSPWTGYRIWALIWLAAIFYGGLIPFDFAPLAPAVRDAGGWWSWLGATLTSPSWHRYAPGVSPMGLSAAWSDALANLVLFSPVGAFLVWDRPRERWASAWIRAVVLVAAASWSLECAQSLSPARFGTVNDAAANTVSGALGATGAVAARWCAGPVVFWCYRRFAALRFVVGDAWAWVGASRRRAWAVALTAGAAVAWASWASGRSAMLGGWLPFAQAFERSYDVAAWRLGLAAVGYLLLLVAAGAPLMAMRARGGLVGALAVVAGWAVLIELGHAVRGGATGATGPLLAIGVSASALTGVVLVDAVIRRRDRRKRSEPVTVERRRRVHRYGA